MTPRAARAAVWRAFPRRSSTHWDLTIQEHHTSTPAHRVYRWWLDGRSARQDPIERQGFVDTDGVTIERRRQPPTTRSTPNYPDERGRGVPHPSEFSLDTRASMDRAWRDAEERDARIQAAADAAYARFLENKGGK